MCEYLKYTEVGWVCAHPSCRTEHYNRPDVCPRVTSGEYKAGQVLCDIPTSFWKDKPHITVSAVVVKE